MFSVFLLFTHVPDKWESASAALHLTSQIRQEWERGSGKKETCYLEGGLCGDHMVFRPLHQEKTWFKCTWKETKRKQSNPV